MTPPVVVIGGGGHAKVVVSTLHAGGTEVMAIFDDTVEKWGTEMLGVPIRGPIVDACAEADRQGAWRAIVAIGDNTDRRMLVDKLGLEWTTAIHPAAWLDPSVEIGPGTVIFAGAVIQPSTRLGAHVIVNTGATIDHDNSLGDYVHVAPGATLAGTIAAEDGVFVGSGATVVPKLRLGAWSTVGAGATVVRPVAAGTTVAGTPAAPLRRQGDSK